MSPVTLRYLLSVFLVLHGLVTMSLATVPAPAPGALHTPFFPAWWRLDIDTSWPISRIGLPPVLVRTLGWVLWGLVLICFIIAAVSLSGLVGHSTLWQLSATIAAVLSLLLLGFYWHPWLIMGVVINVFILVGVTAGWVNQWLSI